ncbi:MAG: divalent metal cation transporter [Bacteroidia bacterium]|nr:divalent metal cation transporter [Bacteroidia bacterium]
MLSKLKALGPGLLYAGAAVGVSHIVQSTRAGAEYGYILIIGIILAHIFKYPFFELGPKFTQFTGQNLLHGYARLSKWALVVVAILTVATMFTIQAAVTIVTAGLALKITNLAGVITPVTMSVALLIICTLISAVGRFNVLDKLMKVIMVTLSITTVVAVVSSFTVHHNIVPGATKVFSVFEPTDLIFLIAFLGWMPAPLDISIWHSIWSEEKLKQDGELNKEGNLFDFNVGFIGTAILGIGFLTLGARIIYGSGVELAAGGVAYSKQFIDIYQQSIGTWAYWIIAIAAFTTMFSTTLTCLDAMPRVLTKIGELTFPVKNTDTQGATLTARPGRARIYWMLVIVAGALVLLQFFIKDMKQMVNLATSFSFLTAPVLALLGILIVKKQLPEGFWPKWKYGIAYLGVLFLIVLSIFYLGLKFNGS